MDHDLTKAALLPTDPAFDAAFMAPALQGKASNWYGHVPFGHWLVTATEPLVVVEVGTRDGVSYAAFCEAVLRAGLPTRCRALLTAEADPGLHRFHDPRYGSFSRLIRDDAARHDIADGSVDLLHLVNVDPARLEAALALWWLKLSERAVLLLHACPPEHPIAGRLCASHPWFAFSHGGGLLVIAVGPAAPAAVAALCGQAGAEAIAACAARFAHLGERWEIEAQRHAAPGAGSRHQDLQRALAARSKELQRTQAARLRAEHEAQIASSRASEALHERDLLLNSTFWRMTYPLRLLVGRVRRLRSIALMRKLRNGATRLALRRSGRPASDPTSATAVAREATRVVFVSGEPHTPGHIYRVVRAAAAAEAAGAQAVVMTIQDMSNRLEELAGAALLVVWRAEWNVSLAQLYAAARRQRIPVAFDLDDLMLRPDLARVEVIDGIRSQNYSEDMVSTMFTNIQVAVAEADLCFATTPEIAYAMRSLQKPTFLLPNGFDDSAMVQTRLAVRSRAAGEPEGVVRIGYASGSRTHQRDFAIVAGAVARLLAERPHCRLVLFRAAADHTPLLDIEEFEALQDCLHQIEWRDMVPAELLGSEIARFDINLAPLEVGNPFCEAKSELKFFEAAVANVCTIASPTGPFVRAIRAGETGLLAEKSEEWFAALALLADDPALRRRMAQAAFHAVLYPYGQQRRTDMIWSQLRQLEGGRAGGRAFALDVRSLPSPSLPELPEGELVYASDRLGTAQVTVIIPVYNYERYVEEALDSVARQSLELLDLVVVDDHSTDGSLEVVLAWIRRHAERFNRLVVQRNVVNAGLAQTRNAGFAAAETPFVLPLDADNRLLPECAARCLETLGSSGAAFAYPRIQCFGLSDAVMGNAPFLATRLVGGNNIDAMALVGKWAWAAAGGYRSQRLGWEDYEFWCKLVSRGFWGVPVPAVLAEYRVHGDSMLHRTTEQKQNKTRLVAEMQSLHPWLAITLPELQPHECSAAVSGICLPQ